jgi:D-glycerate 3-kinase
MTLAPSIEALIATEGLPPSYADVVERVHRPLTDDIAVAAQDGPLVAGLCGAQGSGKSTAVKFVKWLLEERGARVAVVSLDDLYLTRGKRAVMAALIHPLFATRGVPGTHDVTLGLSTLDRLRTGSPTGQVVLPRFDKSQDTRAAPTDADVFEGRADVALFEGWCVGAVPQTEADLEAPINALERERDTDAVWRRYVNEQLSGPYQELFGRLGFLALFAAPGFERVLAWRTEQERKLREKVAAAGGGSRVMTDAEVAIFIQHYERLTRHILAEMPGRADVTVGLGEERQIVSHERREA